VDIHYRISPPITGFITEHPSLKQIVRIGWASALAMAAVAIKTARAKKAATLGLLALGSAALVVWAKQRPGKGPEYTQG
jgi:hypothetical protein